jgi:hypothetical protein
MFNEHCGRHGRQEALTAAALFFFFLVVLGLELRVFTLSHFTSPIFVKSFSR